MCGHWAVLGIGRAYLGNEDDDDDGETEPRTGDTTSSLEWDLVKSVAVVSPRLTETDVGQADGSPGEEGGKTGQRNEPVEDDDTGSSQVHVGQTSPGKDEDDRPERATGAVNVGEALGSIALLTERGQSSRSTVNTRHTNGHDGNENDDVHEAVETNETGILGGDDKGRGIRTTAVGTEETLIVGTDKQTDKGETENVEEGDTPEDLSDSSGEGLERVLGLGSSQTDQLSSREGESGGDENGTETLEAVVERAWVVPSTGTPVFGVQTVAGASTTNENEGDDHEDDSRAQLQAGRPKLLFSVSQRSEQIDEDDEDPEDGHEDSQVCVFGAVPILHSDTSDLQFEW
jgi:hypothetical protein